jgi:transposase InsO family protein
MDDARSRIEAWRFHYNQVRPHSGLDNPRRKSLLYVTSRLRPERNRTGGQVRN